MALPVPTLAIRGVTLIDGSGAAARDDMTVHVAGERIIAVNGADGLATHAGVPVLDGRGRWLIPGLVDMHVHVNLCGQEALPLWLANGVTSVRDIGGDVDRLIPWRAELAAGRLTGPRLFTYGPMIDGAPSTFAGGDNNFGGLWSEVDGPRAGVAEAERLISAGVDGFKLYQNLPLETLTAIIRHIDGRLPVTGHLCRTLASEAIAAGINCLEHTMLTPYNDVCRLEDRTPPDWTMRTPGFWRQVQEGWARADLGAAHARAFFELLAESGVYFDPTSSLGTNALDLDESDEEAGQRYLTPTLRAARARNAERARAAGTAGGLNAGDAAVLRAAAERQLEFVQRLHEAGGVVLAGTDTGAVQPLVPGFSLHRELRWLVRAGMRPETAIARATRDAAAALRRGDDQGTIRPGQRADMVLLDADPLADIRNTRQIHRVIKDGSVYDPAELLADCERRFGAGG